MPACVAAGLPVWFHACRCGFMPACGWERLACRQTSGLVLGVRTQTHTLLSAEQE